MTRKNASKSAKKHPVPSKDDTRNNSFSRAASGTSFHDRIALYFIRSNEEVADEEDEELDELPPPTLEFPVTSRGLECRLEGVLPGRIARFTLTCMCFPTTFNRCSERT